MKLFAWATLALFATVVTATVNRDWNSEDDEELVRAVAAAALDQEGSNIHRVTKSTFKMADPTAQLCRSDVTPPHNPHLDYYYHVPVSYTHLTLPTKA